MNSYKSLREKRDQMLCDEIF